MISLAPADTPTELPAAESPTAFVWESQEPLWLDAATPDGRYYFTAGDGTEHVGDSRIVSPMGELLATASGVETILLADVDPAEVTATRDRLRFLPDRRG